MTVSLISARQMFCSACKKMHAAKKYPNVTVPFICKRCEASGVTVEGEKARLLEKWSAVIGKTACSNPKAMLIEPSTS